MLTHTSQDAGGLADSISRHLGDFPNRLHRQQKNTFAFTPGNFAISRTTYAYPSPERHIQHHHHGKTKRHAGCRQVAVPSAMRLGNDLFDNDKDHGTRSEA